MDIRYTPNGHGDWRASDGKGRMVIIRKVPSGMGPGYYIDPILGFQTNPFGLYTFKNIVAAKREIETVFNGRMA